MPSSCVPLATESSHADRAHSLVRFTEIAKSFGPVRALDGVDLTIEEGQCVGLVGESGCGKSTLARLVARLIEPTSGALHFAGSEIGAISLRAFTSSPLRAASSRPVGG